LHYLLDEADAVRTGDKVPKSTVEYRRALQNHIYKLVHSDGNAQHYMELTEVCHQSTPPVGAISAANCHEDNENDNEGEEWCYFVLPEGEAESNNRDILTMVALVHQNQQVERVVVNISMHCLLGIKNYFSK
jgi:hypothetical protein